MSAAQLGFLCGCFWFGIFLVGQLVVFRLCETVMRSRILLRGIFAATAAAMVTVAVLPISDTAAMLLAEIYAVTTVGCLFVLYGPFFYAVHTSLSVESLLLLIAMGGRAPLDELRARFASRQLLEARLRTMVEYGYLVCEDEQLLPTPRARRIGLVFVALKSLWRLGPGG